MVVRLWGVMELMGGLSSSLLFVAAVSPRLEGEGGKLCGLQDEGRVGAGCRRKRNQEW